MIVYQRCFVFLDNPQNYGLFSCQNHCKIIFLCLNLQWNEIIINEMETPENKQVNLKYSKDFMILALLVGLVMLTAHVYDMAPALIPTHFGLNLSSPMGYGPKSSLLVVAVIGICFGLAGVAAGHSKNLPIRINGLSMRKMNEVQKEALRQLVYRFTVCIILLCACVVMLLVPVVLPRVAVTVLFILLFAWLLYSAVNASFKIRRMR